MYKLTYEGDRIIRVSEYAVIPKDKRNTDYQEYLEWLDAGNTPLSADPPQDIEVPLVLTYSTIEPTSFRDQIQNGIDNLVDYLQLASPTAGQSAAALKILIRLVLYMVRRSRL
jgi:hypothetical protein